MTRMSASREQLTEKPGIHSPPNGEPSEKETTTSDPVSGKGCKWWPFIIEPVLMLYMAPFSAMFTLESQYILSAMNERYNVTSSGNATNGSSTCGKVDTDSDFYKQQQKAQGAATIFTLILNLSTDVPTLFIALFLGSYTDRRGRRLALILPTVGIILRMSSFIVQQAARLPLEVVILGSLLDGLGGSVSIMASTCYAYLSDTVSVEKRSLRITAAEFASNMLQGVLQISLGFIIARLGYLWPFVLFTGLHVINLIYIIFFVPESRSSTASKANTPYLIIESFKTVGRKREKPQPRSLLLLCLFSYSFLTISQQSQWGVENFLLLNTPLCMDSILVGFWKLARILIESFSALAIGFLLLQRLGDGPVIIMSCISAIAYFMIFPFSVKPWMAFVALVPGFAARINIPIVRSQLSKLVTLDEQGGLLAVVYVVEKVCALLGKITMKNIYTATLLVFRGTSYMCIAGLLTVGLVLFIIFYIKSRPKKEEPEVHEVTKF